MTVLTASHRTLHALGAMLLMIGCAGSRAGSAFDQPRPAVDERELGRDEQARHVLNRLAFGPRPGEVERIRAMGVDRWIAQQLTPDRIDDAALRRALAHFPSSSRSAAELLRDAPPPALLRARQPQRDDSMRTRPPALAPAAGDSVAMRQGARRNRQFVGEILAARVARAVGSERQLQEVMTDFWLNHFSVYVGKGQLRYFLADYERDAIRPHVLGRFRDLLGSVARNPAMLLYLDNAQSVADSAHRTLSSRAVRRRVAVQRPPLQRPPLPRPAGQRPRGLNENYARELLELHTLGVDGGYTQQDVIEVARALTGWGVRPLRSGAPEFWFNRNAHDAEPKRVLGVTLRGGRGMEDGEDVLDLLARHPATARFIARKLAVRFVSDSPPGALVERAAATFRRTDGDLREVVRTIVTSPEFFTRAAYRAKVKSPFEVVVSTARALGAEPDTTTTSSLAVARLGAPIFGHQAPNGWPETGDAWMNTGAILSRINFALAVAANRVPGARVTAWPSYAALRAAPREQQVDGVIVALLGGSVSSDTRAILMSGEHPLAREGLAPSPDDRPPGDPPRRPLRPAAPLAGLDQVIGLALGSPEFQRR
ncbi:MAG: DUF1800 domain-containing protein [Gemmatimonadaceae bacterium]|nr:DUF1800 domain-containing protein [Gemmatimonadaceae bacterium]